MHVGPAFQEVPNTSDANWKPDTGFSSPTWPAKKSTTLYYHTKR